MELRKAAAIAAKFTTKEGAMSHIRLSPGRMAATNGMQGVVIDIPDLQVEPVTVPAVNFAKMVGALAGPILTLEKGRKLAISEGTTTFRLRAIPETAAPDIAEPPSPAGKWRALTLPEFLVLSRLAAYVDPNARGVAGLTALRLTPHWAAAATNSSGVVAHIEGLVQSPALVPPELFLGASAPTLGAISLLVQRTTAWLRVGDQVRWTRLLEGEWPDNLIDLVAEARTTAPLSRHVELPDLGEACRRVQLATTLGALPATLTFGEEQIRITAGGDTLREFEHTLPATHPVGAKTGVVHVNPVQVANICDLLAGPGVVKMGAEFRPIYFGGISNSPLVEGVSMPLVSPAAAIEPSAAAIDMDAPVPF